MNPKIKGVIVPPITPFNAQGQVDLAAIKRLVDFLIEEGVHALVAGAGQETGLADTAGGQDHPGTDGIRLRFGTGQAQVELVLQDREDVRSHEGRRVGADGDALDAEGEQLEQADLDKFPNADGTNCETCMYWWAEGVEAALP